MTSARQYEQTIRERCNLALLAEEGEPIGGRVPAAADTAAASESPVSSVAAVTAELASSSSASSDSLLTPPPVVRTVRAGIRRVVV